MRWVQILRRGEDSGSAPKMEDHPLVAFGENCRYMTLNVKLFNRNLRAKAAICNHHSLISSRMRKGASGTFLDETPGCPGGIGALQVTLS